MKQTQTTRPTRVSWSSRAPWLVRPPAWMPRLAFAPQGQAPRGDVLVCVFQRGGMDGLNALVPVGDSEYYRARPTLAIPEPKSGKPDAALDLDGFFGLHPALAPLKPVWDAGALAPIHACGSPDPTHSHFDAMDTMERGTPGEKTLGTGWLGRHLAMLNGGASPLRAVGMGAMLQAALRGPAPAVAFQSIADFHLKGRQNERELAGIQQTLAALYAGPAAGTAAQGLGAASTAIDEIMALLSKVNVAGYTPAKGAQYPEGDFGMGLMQVAQLIKAEVGLEVACIDIGGWDTHANQADELAARLGEFGQGLAALYTDLGDRMRTVTVVTMSEFGRRVAENGSAGTDHGHANAMFVLGDGVTGGRVHGDWPGLARERLDGPGDLALTTDYRDVLSEMLAKRLGNPNPASVFPGYAAQMRGVFGER